MAELASVAEDEAVLDGDDGELEGDLRRAEEVGGEEADPEVVEAVQPALGAAVVRADAHERRRGGRDRLVCEQREAAAGHPERGPERQGGAGGGAGGSDARSGAAGEQQRQEADHSAEPEQRGAGMREQPGIPDAGRFAVTTRGRHVPPSVGTAPGGVERRAQPAVASWSARGGLPPSTIFLA